MSNIIMYPRIQKFRGIGKNSCFFWGPRQAGKSTLLKQIFPPDHCKDHYYNFLDPQVFEQFSRAPSLLRERLQATPQFKGPVILDEVQKVPHLLDLVQLLIDDLKIQFILCGSSARKLKRGGGNLLGGRALRYELFPLVSHEITDFDLLKALNSGFLPRHYLSDNPEDLMRAYVGDYLKEEILAEGLTRNIQAFSRFLDAAAFSNGEMVNFTNIASETGVHSTTIKEYFQILEDTLIGRTLPSFQMRPKRRVLKAPRFYFFDVGVANFLLKRGKIFQGNEVFGRAFEHFLFQELVAHSHYSRLFYPMSYWRTTSQLEVDFILGKAEVAVEVKGTPFVQPQHLRGVFAFQEEYRPKRSLVVCLEEKPRRVQTVEIIPWRLFLDQLWSGSLIQ